MGRQAKCEPKFALLHSAFAAHLIAHFAAVRFPHLASEVAAQALGAVARAAPPAHVCLRAHEARRKETLHT